MQAHIHTIPLIDAFTAEDECPFCFALRKLEEDTIEYTVGTCCSYMEKDVRKLTDEQGFCRHHHKMLFQYGNFLGLGLIHQTYLERLRRELSELTQEKPEKKKLFQKKQQEKDPAEVIVDWARKREESCFVCDHIRTNYKRYLETFFSMLKDDEFRRAVEQCRGFCLPHFADLVETARTELPGAYHQWFYDAVFKVMEDNLARVQEDLDLFILRHDYKHQKDDPKNSRDAVPRTSQKLGGTYVNLPVFKRR